jgi:hypothetical protein
LNKLNKYIKKTNISIYILVVDLVGVMFSCLDKTIELDEDEAKAD